MKLETRIVKAIEIELKSRSGMWEGLDEDTEKGLRRTLKAIVKNELDPFHFS